MNMFTKVIKVLYNTLMTIIIIAGLSFVLSYAYGIQPFVVESGSMEPQIHVGSVCFVNTRAKYEDIKLDDIIAFNSKGGMRVTHRVVSISEEGFEIKGDANETKDGPIVTREGYIGKTLFSVPKVGFVIKEIQKPTGMIIGGITIIIFVLIGFLFDDSKEEKAKHEKEKAKKQPKKPQETNTKNPQPQTETKESKTEEPKTEELNIDVSEENKETSDDNK